jgi:hypothetical protein
MSRILFIGLVLLAAVPRARASGVDEAARIVVIPRVGTSSLRESRITITNPGPEWITIDALYVGADGTPSPGPLTCNPQKVPAEGSLSVLLSDLCGLAPRPDAAEFGYLELTSTADARGNFFATSRADGDEDALAVQGYPAGDFDPAMPPGTRVIGVRNRPAAQEFLACYVAALSEAKTVVISVIDGGTSNLLLSTRVSLAARTMQRVDVNALLRRDRENLRIDFTSPDASLLVAGCALERPGSERFAYRLAQSPDPGATDTARMREVHVEGEMYSGRYVFGTAFNYNPKGGATTKMILSTYLQWDDTVRCAFERPTINNFYPGDPSPSYELQVRDPGGSVVAGGSGIQDTGVFRTGHRGRLPASAGQRWQIELSYNEGAGWDSLWHFAPGYWGLYCQSASGMTEPLPLAGASDDF